MNKMITQVGVKEFFEYKKGHLYWRKRQGKKLVGSLAGYYATNGYVYIRFNSHLYREHRLIWLYHYGNLPKMLDHIDRDRSNNCIENLREANNLTNTFNTSLRKDNTTGYKGVSRRSDRKYRPYRAELKIGSIRIRSGTYVTAKEAAIAYNNLAIKHFGEFANLNIV